MTTVKLIEIDGEVGFVLPDELVQRLDIKEGDSFDWSITPEGDLQGVLIRAGKEHLSPLSDS